MIVSPGDVVWAVDPGGRGGGKLRPVVIIYVDEIGPIGVGCSSTVYNPMDWCNVLLPSGGASGTPQFSRDTWAVCGWIVPMGPDDVKHTNGHVPDSMLEDIQQKVRQCRPSSIPSKPPHRP